MICIDARGDRTCLLKPLDVFISYLCHLAPCGYIYIIVYIDIDIDIDIYIYIILYIYITTHIVYIYMLSPFDQ